MADKQEHGSTLNEAQTRMLAIGLLTSAANALTMGNSKADRFAWQQVQTVLPILDAMSAATQVERG